MVPLAAGETTALDVVTVAIAGYAAIVATAAIVFNVVSWLWAWSTRVEVQLRLMDRIDPAAQTHEEVVLFDLINHSDHPTKVTHVGIAPSKRGDKALFIPRPLPTTQPLPIPIGPRDATDVWIMPDTLAEVRDLAKPMRAQIGTADGKSFRSKKVRLRPS